MAIAKELATVDPKFIQQCPLCGRSNRIVVQGLFVLGDKVEKHPDMGYSFCNCKDIYYTKSSNVTESRYCTPDINGDITYPDPFFAWPDPYQFLYWDVRKYQILWDMDSLCEHLKDQGFNIVSAIRDFDPASKTPQHFHIKIKRCQE